MQELLLKELEQLKVNKPSVFIGHCFYGEKRVEKYRATLGKIFSKKKYDIKFGTKESFQDDADFFKEIKRLIKKSRYCIFDLAGYGPKKLRLNLNVLLEAGVGIGANRKVYILSPKKGKCGRLIKEITDLSGRYMRLYNKNNSKNFKREIIEIKKRVDEHWKATKFGRHRK